MWVAQRAPLMSAPAAVPQPDQRRIAGTGSGSRQTPFWICSECGNMLHPKEDKVARKLKRECRNCNREDDADSNLVHVNDMRPEGSITEAGSDTIADPTLPRAHGTECLSCGHMEAVFFQARCVVAAAAPRRSRA